MVVRFKIETSSQQRLIEAAVDMGKVSIQKWIGNPPKFYLYIEEKTLLIEISQYQFAYGKYSEEEEILFKDFAKSIGVYNERERNVVSGLSGGSGALRSEFASKNNG